jgi:hypothetical protein
LCYKQSCRNEITFGAQVDLDDIDYDSLPEDPHQAFLAIERLLRQNLATRLTNTEQKYWFSAYFDYVNNIQAAAEALDLRFLSDWKKQSFSDMSEGLFRNFLADVDKFITKTRITQGRRTKGYSVAFDAAAKAKIRHFLDQIREIVDKAEIDDRKREALYARIAALQAEVDRSRTRFEALGAYFVETAGLLGEAGKKIEPLTNSIAKVFGIAKSAEDAALSLPKAPELRKLNPPLPLPDPLNDSIDDDIPF